MGDSCRLDPGLGYLYSQHSSAIHSDQRLTVDRGLTPVRVPASLYSLPGTAQASLPHHRPRLSRLSTHPQQPTLSLLNPLLQLVYLNNTRASKQNIPHTFPTVIVSPHSTSPSSDRASSRSAASNNFASAVVPRQQLDVHCTVSQGVQSGASSMSANGMTTMGGKRDEGFAPHRTPRPSLISQPSNSVPSTPHQYPREVFSRSRSPSPNGGLGSHSPRSVSSEANSTMPSLRKARGGCRFETNAAFGRRRIPYISSDILEKAKEEPKKGLDPQEDKKLSGDMRELYDRLLPSEESKERRSMFVKKLENILHTEWPGNEFKVHVFGSSGNLLFTSESDGEVLNHGLL